MSYSNAVGCEFSLFWALRNNSNKIIHPTSVPHTQEITAYYERKLNRRKIISTPRYPLHRNPNVVLRVKNQLLLLLVQNLDSNYKLGVGSNGKVRISNLKFVSFAVRVQETASWAKHTVHSLIQDLPALIRFGKGSAKFDVPTAAQRSLPPCSSPGQVQLKPQVNSRKWERRAKFDNSNKLRTDKLWNVRVRASSSGSDELSLVNSEFEFWTSTGESHPAALRCAIISNFARDSAMTCRSCSCKVQIAQHPPKSHLRFVSVVSSRC